MNAWEAVERWLEVNTFECPVGRVSPEQCARNRGKPSLREYNRLGDRARLRRKYPHWKGPEEGFRPTACEVCRDWERLCREVEERRRREDLDLYVVENPERPETRKAFDRDGQSDSSAKGCSKSASLPNPSTPKNPEHPEGGESHADAN